MGGSHPVYSIPPFLLHSGDAFNASIVDFAFRPFFFQVHFPIGLILFLIYYYQQLCFSYLTMSSPAPFPFPSSAPSDPLPSSRPMIDPLAFDNVRGLQGSIPGANGTAVRAGADEAEEVDEVTGRRRGGGAGRQARLNNTDDIPRVKDTTGEKVMESFAMFLEK